MACDFLEVKSYVGSAEVAGRPARVAVMCKLHGRRLARQTDFSQDRKLDARVSFDRADEDAFRHREWFASESLNSNHSRSNWPLGHLSWGQRAQDDWKEAEGCWRRHKLTDSAHYDGLVTQSVPHIKPKLLQGPIFSPLSCPPLECSSEPRATKSTHAYLFNRHTIARQGAELTWLNHDCWKGFNALQYLAYIQS